ncbi:MAG: YgaP-like transmembrane domain [Vicinamibacterales bacterium]
MLPHNMGRLHRLAYLAIGAATIAGAIALPEVPRAARLGLGLLGLMALGSSISGYCVTCHTLGLTTRDDRVRRIS